MATHLAASMRVVALHQHRRRVTIADARDEVLKAAQYASDGTDVPDVQALVMRLERVTGATIEDLGRLAVTWHDA